LAKWCLAPGLWLLYEVVLLVGLLLYLPKAVWRRRLPHRGWSMRLGRYPREVSDRLRGHPSVWIHAVSVGEVQAVRPLAAALAEATGDPLTVSTITPGGFALASTVAKDHGVAMYFPLDLRPCVRRALEAIRPRLLLLVESEFWPTVIRSVKARGVPIAVVNGRISPRAFRRYRWVKPILRRTLQEIDVFLMQSQADAARVIALGAPAGKVQVAGSLKWDASVGTRPSEQAIAETAASLGLNGRDRVIVAGSTHRGEEEPLLDAFKIVRAAHGRRIRLILAPRHLERLAEVEALVRQHGLTPVRLSASLGPGWDVGLVDRFGELPRYYGLATVAFIGGSLVPHGGQNPLEAASLGKPVVFGPFMHNFDEIAQQLVTHQAARQLTRDEELAAVLQQLVTNPGQAEAMGQRAQALIQRCQGTVQRTMALLAPLMAPGPSGKLGAPP